MLQAPARGGQSVDTGEDYDAEPLAFEKMPIGRRTALGLAEAGFTNMTRIQAGPLGGSLTWPFSFLLFVLPLL